MVPICTPERRQRLRRSGRVDVVLTVGTQKRKRREAFDKIAACTRPDKALQQFLQYESCGHHDLTALKRVAQRFHLWRVAVPITPESQGPDARVNQ